MDEFTRFPRHHIFSVLNDKKRWIATKKSDYSAKQRKLHIIPEIFAFAGVTERSSTIELNSYLKNKNSETNLIIPGKMVIPVLSIAGDAFSIGRQIGQQSASIMHRYLRHSPIWQKLKKQKDSQLVKEMKAAVSRKLPLYYQEIEGIANGADLDIQDIFLWNCRGDLLENSAEGCTTLLAPGDQTTLIGHNEDGDPFFRNHVFIAEIKPEKGIGFTSFVYPCSLPGHAFAVSDVGLVQTVNNLRPKVKGRGIPRQFLSRAILDAENLDQVLTLFNRFERSGGFHHLLAQRGDNRVLSVEALAGQLSIKPIVEPYGHANHLIHHGLAESPQTITPSSRSRQTRIDEICRQQTIPDPSTICQGLWDQTERELPIYREDSDDLDNENTLATALFEISNDRIDFSVYQSKNRPALFKKTFRWQRDASRI